MNLTILFFGALTDACEISELKINSVQYPNTESLNKYLHSVYPKLSKQKYKIAVNQELINDSVDLKEGDEVSLLPPFAGG